MAGAVVFASDWMADQPCIQYAERSDPATHWTVCIRGELEEGERAMKIEKEKREADKDEDKGESVQEMGMRADWGGEVWNIWDMKMEGGSNKNEPQRQRRAGWESVSERQSVREEERERQEGVLEKRWSMERWWLTPVVVKLWFILSVFSGSYTVGVWGSLLALGHLEQRLRQLLTSSLTSPL